MVGGWHKGRIVRLFVGWFSTAGKLNSTNKSMLQKNRWRNLKVQAQDLSARGVHHPFPKITARTADACPHFEAQNIISVQCAAQICKVKLDQANVMSFAFCFTLVRLTWCDSYDDSDAGEDLPSESESDNGDDEDKEDADADDILMLMQANLPRAESTFHTAPTVNAYSYRLASNGLLVIIIIINIFTITTLKRK